MAKSLGTSTRSKVLIAAFSRSLRDPFVHARNAAVMAFGATAEHFSDEDSAGRILPALCPLLLDKEKLIRDQANRTLEVHLQKIRKAAAGMPDSALPPPQSTDAQVPRMGTPQASSVPGGWTGWAISSFTNKLSAAAGDMQTANGSGATSPAFVTSPTVESRRLATASASDLHRQAVKSPDLSGAASPNPSAIAEEFLQEDHWDDGGDSWGNIAEEDGFFDASAEPAGNKAPAVQRNPSYVEDGEPDFAGWLAAQAQKKSGPGKALPRGLSKAPAAKKVASKPAAKPVVTKKIDMKPKETDDDEGDGWGDGW